MIFKLIWRGVIISLCMITSAHAASLLDIYRMTKNNNPQWQNLQTESKLSNIRHKASQGRFLPQVGLTGQYDFYWVDSAVAQPPTLSNDEISSLNQCLIANNDYNFCLGQVSEINCEADPACLVAQSGADQRYQSAKLGVTVRQVLYEPQLWQEHKQSALTQQQATLTRKQNQQEFLKQLIEAYLLVLSQREESQIDQRQQQQNQQQLDLLEQRFEKGLVGASEVLYGRATLHLQTSQLEQSRQKVRSAHHTLEAFTVQTLNQVTGLSETVPMPGPNPGTSEEWIELANTQNPLLGRLKQQITMAELEQKKRLSQSYPKVHLVGGVGLNRGSSDASLGSTDQNTASLGVEVSMPLYTGGSLSQGREEAVELRNQAILEHKARQAQVQRDIELAFGEASRAFEQLTLVEQALKALQLQTQNLETSFQSGVVDAQKVFDARQLLFQTQKQRQLIRFDYIRSSISLKQHAGVLSEEDIFVIASWSDQDAKGQAPKQSLFDSNKSWLGY